jgi:hypothetical protein
MLFNMILMINYKIISDSFISTELQLDPDKATFQELKKAYIEAENAVGRKNFTIVGLKFKGLDLKDEWNLSKIRYSDSDHLEIYLKKVSLLDMI